MRPERHQLIERSIGAVFIPSVIRKNNVSSAYDSPKSARKSNVQRIRYNDRRPMKEKEPKCLTCGSMPWRVKGIKCKGSVKVDVPLIDEEGNVEYIVEKRPCGLRYAEEGPIEIPFNPLQSMLGSWDK